MNAPSDNSQPHMNTFWQNIIQFRLNCIFIILYLALSAHGASITNTFKVLDNEISIVENELIKSPEHLKTIFVSSYFDNGQFYRPLVAFSHMVEYQLFGLKASYYHLTNIILHGVSAVLVFFIMNFLLKRRAPALLIGILFAIHPIHWEAVANIPGRSILLCTVFYLFSFYSFCRTVRDDRSARWYIMSLLSFIAALLSKESAVMLPAVLLLYIWFIVDKKDRSYYSLATVPYWGLCGIVMMMRNLLGITNVNFSGGITESILPFITFLKSVLMHLKLMLIPSGFYYDRSYQVFSDVSAPGVFVTIFLWGTIISVLLIKRKSIAPMVMFFILWFIASLFLVSQLLFFVAPSPGHIAASDHLLYIPSIGVFAALIFMGAAGVERMRKAFPRWSLFIKYPIITFFAFFFIVTVENDIYARNETVMLMRSYQNNPHNRRVHQSYAVALNRAGYFSQAEDEFRTLLESHPSDVRAHVGLGRVFCDQKMLLPCIDQFQQALHYSGGEISLVKDLKRLYGYFIEEAQKKIDDGKGNPQLYQQLGAAYMSVGKLQETEQYFEKSH